ncbi:hypothetical protein [Aliiroseovarius sp. 2305UL8-7]|uniref:hypothetical protein n=1 Tax=Aliiroseovarius conchicola TaxID=3121637 RepID=UPI003529A0EB
MAKTSSAKKISISPKQHSDLVAGKTLILGDYQLDLTIRSSARLVVCFFDADEDTSWLDSACQDANFSQIRIVAGSASAFGNLTFPSFAQSLATSKLVQDFNAVSLCGAMAGGGAVLRSGAYFERATLVAFDPQLAQVSGPQSSGNIAFNPGSVGYVFHDPLTGKQTALNKSLSGENILWLKCFGMQEPCLNGLWRMRVLPQIVAAALRDELAPGLFYKLIRRRKDYYFYRIGIEAALNAKGQTPRVKRFRAKFRARREKANEEAKFSDLKAKAEQMRPQLPNAWARVNATSTARWPSAGGNVWMLEQTGDHLRYLSDQWQHVTMGFEERSGVTLAQTPAIALGFVGFGAGLQVERPLPRRFEWHVTDEALNGSAPAFGALAEATVASENRYAAGDVLHSVIAVSQPQSGIVAEDASVSGKAYRTLIKKVEFGHEALQSWGKSLVVDRIRLGLLAGAQNSTQNTAADHYTEVASNITRDIARVTGQSTTPAVVVVQSAGSQTDGASEVMLAEGRFDIENPALPAVVATPTYPWRLMPGTPMTLSAGASLTVDELCAVALQEKQQGRSWYCPSLQMAVVKGTVIHAEFSSLAGLVLEDGPHGFRIDQQGEAPTILSAKVVSDRGIEIECDRAPAHDGSFLCYAWGHKAPESSKDCTANHGALRDKWQQNSIISEGRVLRRYALAGRVPLMFGDAIG